MQKMMDAIVKTHKGKGLELKRVPVPTPKMGEVLIKIHKTAICGTDVHINNWDSWSEKNLVPHWLSVIICRRNHELGEGVTAFHVGQGYPARAT